MNKPLLTQSEAHRRASELLTTFERDPDVLSPDEQALAMGIRISDQAGRDLAATVRATIASQIEAIARGHYARDIRGTLAMNDWEGFVKALREPL